jgi:hypothetical protein
LLAGAIWRIAALRHDAFEFHAIQQLDAIIEAFGIAQPVGIYGDDPFLEPGLALE